MEKILLLGDGSLLRGILILPFAVSGLVLVAKGAVAHLDKLLETHPELNKLKNWQASALFLFHLLCYVGVFYAASRLL